MCDKPDKLPTLQLRVDQLELLEYLIVQEINVSKRQGDIVCKYPRGALRMVLIRVGKAIWSVKHRKLDDIPRIDPTVHGKR